MGTNRDEGEAFADYPLQHPDRGPDQTEALYTGLSHIACFATVGCVSIGLLPLEAMC